MSQLIEIANEIGATLGLIGFIWAVCTYFLKTEKDRKELTIQRIQTIFQEDYKKEAHKKMVEWDPSLSPEILYPLWIRFEHLAAGAHEGVYSLSMIYRTCGGFIIGLHTKMFPYLSVLPIEVKDDQEIPKFNELDWLVKKLKKKNVRKRIISIFS